MRWVDLIPDKAIENVEDGNVRDPSFMIGSLDGEDRPIRRDKIVMVRGEIAFDLLDQ